MSKKKKTGVSKERNFVAKHMNEFNRAQTHRDRKNDYSRKEKHRNKSCDAFFMTFNSFTVLT